MGFIGCAGAQVGTGKNEFVFQEVRVKTRPAFEGDGFGAFVGDRFQTGLRAFQIFKYSGFMLLALDLYDDAAAILAAEDEVRRVGAPFTVCILVFDSEVGLRGTGESPGEVEILDFIRFDIDLMKERGEEVCLGLGIEVVRIVVETEVAGVGVFLP